ncbi:MAG TPA: NCS2 family permease [Candidatus Sulfomarinibacteraceae bacterium]|nr:NCS2 family permease [Candidatus Sulfomarinibacteraceae bacterium]
MDAIASYFKFAERGTTLATEVKAGVTTFAVMAYIIFLNPLILGVSNADGVLVGPDPVAVGAGTALIAGIMTIAMGVVGNVPIAIAAGLGLNGVVAFGLILGRGLTWQGAMGVIVIEGLVIALLVLVGLREAVMNAVPASLKRAIAVGIGLFILFIGAVDAGLVKSTGIAVPPVQFVFPTTMNHVVALAGLAVTVALYVMRVRAALLISIVFTTALAIIVTELGLGTVKEFPTNLFSTGVDLSTIGQANLAEVFEKLGLLTAILVIFSIMLSDFFDTMGTVTAISEEAGIMTEDGKVPNLSRVLLVDSVAAAAGGFAGVSSNTSYIESAAGVGEGGRTGFTSVVTGILFLVGIVAAPLVLLVPFEASGPVLILVGFLLFGQVRDIDFRDAEEGIPALLTLILMPLSYDITVGIGAGFVSWVFIKVIRGKLSAIHPLMWVVSIAFLVYFARDWLQGII